jgi:hypothetical protein
MPCWCISDSPVSSWYLKAGGSLSITRLVHHAANGRLWKGLLALLPLLDKMVQVLLHVLKYWGDLFKPLLILLRWRTEVKAILLLDDFFAANNVWMVLAAQLLQTL